VSDESEIFRGSLVTLDDVLMSNDMGKIPVWSEFSSDRADTTSLMQVDHLELGEVFLVIDVDARNGSVIVLTPRGKTGGVWIGHLCRVELLRVVDI
jgi:hypothetical protein